MQQWGINTLGSVICCLLHCLFICTRNEITFPLKETVVGRLRLREREKAPEGLTAGHCTASQTVRGLAFWRTVQMNSWNIECQETERHAPSMVIGAVSPPQAEKSSYSLQSIIKAMPSLRILRKALAKERTASD